MNLHLDTYEGSQDDIKLENLRHLSFASRRFEFFKRFEKFLVSVRLRSFIVFHEYTRISYISSDILDRLIPKMRCLKLLCLRGCQIKELPDSVSNLSNLRHLDMSSTHIQLLPESICGLLNLQILKLRYCWRLIELPREVGKLIHLRALDITGTYSLKVMPSRIGHLENLQILSKFIVGENDGVRLKELKDLPLLRGELSIWGLEKVVEVQEARNANLKAKEGLVSIEFKWGEDTNERQIQILDELQPCSSLKSLKIEGYNGKSFPKWVGDFRFAHLETLSLRDCKSARSLPPLGGLVLLKKLEISGMHGVTKLGKEFYEITSSSNQTFPSLETLVLEEMHGLEEWCSCFGNKEEDEVIFPRLQKMEIIKCPVLVGKLPNNLPLLEELRISGCQNLRNLKCRHPSLRELCIEDCSEAALKTLGDLTLLRRLQLRNIREMIYVEDEVLSMLGELLELEIKECKELKSLARRNEKEIEVMAGLEHLMIRKCGELESFGPMRLPSSLKRMEISDCKALKWLPEGFMVDGSGTCEPALEKLSISICPSLATFPSGRFSEKLTNLSIDECENLESMPEFSKSPIILQLHGCSRLRSLPRVPASVVRLDIENLTSLGSEISSNAEKVEDVESELDKIFAHCSSLATLRMKGLNMRRLPETLTSFHMIRYIGIWRCLNLWVLPKQIHELKCLRVLKMEECPNLELLVGQELPPELELLTIMGCERVIGGLFAGGLSPLASLTFLEIDGGSRGLNIIKPEAPLSLPKLRSLWMSNIGNVESLAAAFELPSSCISLWIRRCPNLRELPIHRLSSNLGCLEIRESPALQKRCLDRKGDYWPLISAIPCVRIDPEVAVR